MSVSAVKGWRELSGQAWLTFPPSHHVHGLRMGREVGPREKSSSVCCEELSMDVRELWVLRALL